MPTDDGPLVLRCHCGDLLRSLEPATMGQMLVQCDDCSALYLAVARPDVTPPRIDLHRVPTPDE